MSWLDDIGLRQLADSISAYFARKTQAGGSLGWDGTTITLYAVAGNTLDSANLDSGLATDGQAGHSLSISERTITLSSVNGDSLSSVTVPEQDLSGYATQDWVRRNFISSAGISVNGNTFHITFYDGNGDYEDSVSFTIN